jgi:hypothetical protein
LSSRPRDEAGVSKPGVLGMGFDTLALALALNPLLVPEWVE